MQSIQSILNEKLNPPNLTNMPNISKLGSHASKETITFEDPIELQRFVNLTRMTTDLNYRWRQNNRQGNDN